MNSQQRARQRAWGFGLATIHDSGTVLDTWYPDPCLGDASLAEVPEALAALTGPDERRDVRLEVVRTEIDLWAAPVDVPDAYLRLHLLSHRLVRPHGLDLSGIFGVLPNVVWTSQGPCHPEGFEATRARLRGAGPLQVLGVDKFPRMVDYVLPSGVRIADGDRVRLGAHLASGTTVMHEGFVNYNAGTLGTSMVEGRISAGVVVGDGSDIGGGASIMGTLSGGGTTVISIGERCLLGANSGIGISLGDDCVVEAGCYVTAGTKVTVRAQPEGLGDSGIGSQHSGDSDSDSDGGGDGDGDGDGERGGARVVKAAELSGRSNLTFWRNSVTGAVEVTAREGTWGSLNDALHAND